MMEKFNCAFCGNLAPDGLRIHGELVCPACENRLLTIMPKDDDYPEWISAIRSLWTKWAEEPETESENKTPEPN